MLVGMDDLTVEQDEVLAELVAVQARIKERDTAQEADLEARTRLVDRGRDLGMSQVFIARRIDVKPNVLGQAALRERRRALAV